MRFKAKLVPEQLSLLYNVIVPMTRIASSSSSSSGSSHHPELVSTSVWTKNSCILHYDENFVRLYCKGKSVDTDQIQCYAEFPTRGGGIFVDHRIESAAVGNAICMEVDLAQLRLALQSLVQDKKQQQQQQSSSLSFAGEPFYTVLKLAKRNNVPCLCLDALTTTGGGGDHHQPIQVHHSISVRIMRLADMAYFRPPKVNLTQQNDQRVVVQLELPGDRPLKTVTEGLKALGSGGGTTGGSASSSHSSSVTLHATTNGELTISLDSDGASIRAFFHHLPTVLSSSDNPADNHLHLSPTKSARVKVDTKKLCTCLQWQQNANFPVHRAMLCLVEQELLLVHVDLHPPGVGLQTYYIPILYLSPDENEDDLN